jgi:hypothetical protein
VFDDSAWDVPMALSIYPALFGSISPVMLRMVSFTALLGRSVMVEAMTLRLRSSRRRVARPTPRTNLQLLLNLQLQLTSPLR